MTTKDRYRGLWAEHGPDITSLGWRNIGSQLTRFNVIRDCYIKPGTILDAGCGFGDLSLFFDQDQYTGIDDVPEFIEEARRKYPSKTFLVGDIFDETSHTFKAYDYVFASGLLAFQDDPINMILRLWGVTDNTLAFNWHNARPQDIHLTLQQCGCNIYGIRHDYFPDDTTVYMYRDYP